MNSFLESLTQDFASEQLIESTHHAADKYIANVTGFQRDIEGIILPRNTQQVSALIRRANEHKASLYPFSCGKNWGFGSKLPVISGSFLVDLSQMNRIIEINLGLGYAVIEPGVTQTQLSEKLRADKANWYLDVTGSGKETSIIGNSLDRGIAYNSLRAERLLNLEVVLGSGEILQTGFGAHTDGPLAHLYRFGLGPQLDALFFQSNMGIVTRATISLSPKLIGRTDFRISFEDRNLSVVFDAIHELKKLEIVGGIIRTGDASRSFETMAPLLYERYLSRGHRKTHHEIAAIYKRLNPSPWVSFGMLSGTSAIVKCKRKEMAQRLRKFAKLEFFNESKIAFARGMFKFLGDEDRLAMLEVSEPLRHLVEGTPTDAAIKMVSWSSSEGNNSFPCNADESDEGFMLIVPVAPLSGRDARRLVETTYSICARHSVTPGVTLNTITASLLEGVISLKYARRKSGVEDAERCADALYEKFALLQYMPYRLNVNNMSRYVRPENNFWKTVSLVKNSLDPNRVIAPGRYDLI